MVPMSESCLCDKNNKNQSWCGVLGGLDAMIDAQVLCLCLCLWLGGGDQSLNSKNDSPSHPIGKNSDFPSLKTKSIEPLWGGRGAESIPWEMYLEVSRVQSVLVCLFDGHIPQFFLRGIGERETALPSLILLIKKFDSNRSCDPNELNY